MSIVNLSGNRSSLTAYPNHDSQPVARQNSTAAKIGDANQGQVREGAAAAILVTEGLGGLHHRYDRAA